MFYALIIIAALAKAVMDRSEENNLVFKPSAFWLKSLSWTRKWKREVQPGDDYIGKVEAFPLSSTVLVFLTDGWHAAQFVFLNALIGSIFFYDKFTNYEWVDFLIVSVSFRVIFEGAYRLLKG